MWKSKGDKRRTITPLTWYRDIAPEHSLFWGDRTICAFRGTLPKFSHLLLTLRIIHLFDLGESLPEHMPFHFPELPTSTHHLYLHTRLLKPRNSVWKDSAKPDLTLSLQFELEGDFNWLNLEPYVRNYKFDQKAVPLSQDQKGSNIMAGQIGRLLVDEFMPQIREEFLVHRYIRQVDGKSEVLGYEATKEKDRILEWGTWIDLYAGKIKDHYKDL